jgi:uncharacterized protein
MSTDALPVIEDEGAFSGRLSGTRRSFIRGIAAAGASTMAASALQHAGALDSFLETAEAAHRMPFSDFTAIAASSADAIQVPEDYVAQVVIGYGDRFSDKKGNRYTYGYNNDFLAFFPLDKHAREGLLFVNHEYTSPFYLHGYKPEGRGNPNFQGKSKAEIDLERSTIGNSVVHIRRHRGEWHVVSPSKYNRRIYAGRMPDQPGFEHSEFQVTGPLASDPRVGGGSGRIWGSLGNCSGGTTPWGTAISCEENFDGYGLPLPDNPDFVMGWADPTNDGFPGYPEYHPGAGYRTVAPGAREYRDYGWVCEHDPYDPSFMPRKHTALGRFRHENTAFRHVPGRKFVIYMGDDQNNEAVYKFVSDREFRPHDRKHNLGILEEGTLYVARWEPEGRRRFTAQGQTTPVTADEGTGRWVEVPDSGLSDTRGWLEANFGPRTSLTTENGLHFATNRPEDLEVGPDGAVYIALSNNTSVNDAYGAVRKLVETGNDPTATTFTWTEYAVGGPSGSGDAVGFDSPDNLVFDREGNLWVLTDISTGSLNSGVHAFHANNAVFMVPTQGPNAGVAFRFANLPIESEGTGPYFTPDERTLFVNVQHPGEQAGVLGSPAVFGDVTTYNSYWPRGDKTTGANPSEPLPSTVAITRRRRHHGHGKGGKP